MSLLPIDFTSACFSCAAARECAVAPQPQPALVTVNESSAASAIASEHCSQPKTQQRGSPIVKIEVKSSGECEASSVRRSHDVIDDRHAATPSAITSTTTSAPNMQRQKSVLICQDDSTILMRARQNGGFNQSSSGSANDSYELSDLIRQKQLEALERKYGGHFVARRAAVVIQRFWRNYCMRKQFHRLRHSHHGRMQRFCTTTADLLASSVTPASCNSESLLKSRQQPWSAPGDRKFSMKTELERCYKGSTDLNSNDLMLLSKRTFCAVNDSLVIAKTRLHHSNTCNGRRLWNVVHEEHGGDQQPEASASSCRPTTPSSSTPARQRSKSTERQHRKQLNLSVAVAARPQQSQQPSAIKILSDCREILGQQDAAVRDAANCCSFMSPTTSSGSLNSSSSVASCAAVHYNSPQVYNSCAVLNVEQQHRSNNDHLRHVASSRRHLHYNNINLPTNNSSTNSCLHNASYCSNYPMPPRTTVINLSAARQHCQVSPPPFQHRKLDAADKVRIANMTAEHREKCSSDRYLHNAQLNDAYNDDPLVNERLQRTFALASPSEWPLADCSQSPSTSTSMASITSPVMRQRVVNKQINYHDQTASTVCLPAELASRLDSPDALSDILSRSLPEHECIQHISAHSQLNSAQIASKDRLHLARDHLTHTAVPHRKQLQLNDVARRRQYRIALNFFNKKPERGVGMLISRGFVSPTPSAVAKFLLSRKGLSRQMIGEYLGNLQQPFNMAVLQAFADDSDLSGLEIDAALRRFQCGFRLPGEAQKIERIMEAFARRYIQCNQEACGAFRSSDTIFILAFAIIMLNTDLHSPSVKPERRMKLEDFVKNLKGIDDGGDVDPNLLTGIYQRIRNDELKPSVDHMTQVVKVDRIVVGKKPQLPIAHRRLVCYCRLYELVDPNKKQNANSHQREIFLFNDLILITKILSRKKSAVTYSHRQSHSLVGLQAQPFKSQYYQFGLKITYSMEDKVLYFNARNEDDRSKFLEDLCESIVESDEMETLRIEQELEKQKFLGCVQLTPVASSRLTPRLHSTPTIAASTSPLSSVDHRDSGLSTETDSQSSLPSQRIGSHDSAHTQQPQQQSAAVRRASVNSLDSGMSSNASTESYDSSHFVTANTTISVGDDSNTNTLTLDSVMFHGTNTVDRQRKRSCDRNHSEANQYPVLSTVMVSTVSEV